MPSLAVCRWLFRLMGRCFLGKWICLLVSERFRLVWKCRLFSYSTYIQFCVHWHGGQCLRLVPNYAEVFRLGWVYSAVTLSFSLMRAGDVFNSNVDSRCGLFSSDLVVSWYLKIPRELYASYVLGQILVSAYTISEYDQTLVSYIIIYSFEFFTSALADGLTLEFEWQQVFSCPQDSSRYSGRSQ